MRWPRRLPDAVPRLRRASRRSRSVLRGRTVRGVGRQLEPRTDRASVAYVVNIQDTLRRWQAELLSGARSLPRHPEARVLLRVTGLGGGAWLIENGPEGGSIAEGEGARPPSCEVELSAEVLQRILLGEVNPQVAWQRGDIRVAGELPEAALLLAVLW